ncbi:MAG TPA: GatB/YqeY domain-containing protein [Prolixibacteraceae bacterium]|nr:GatB/YqeY domain-containing protein [Prolixibacteraceae bacterium]
MALFDEISNAIKEAMKAQDKVRLEALRGIKKVMLEAKTAGGASSELSDEDALKIIAKLAKQGKESAAIYAQQGRSDLAEIEMAQVAVFESYLPVMLSDAELTEKIREIIGKTGASGMKDMGKVMGMATRELAGKADGKAIAEKVRSLLQ